MSDRSGYAGKVGHSGAQEVKAIYGQGSTPAGKVRTGEDLRTGRSSGDKK